MTYQQALNNQKGQESHKLKEVGDQWRTPDALFWGINAMFGPLVLDLFTDGENSKCPAFYTAEDNALTQDWSARLAELHGAAFANPPYSRASMHDDVYITGMRHIISHTIAMRELGGRYVFLIKAATGEAWWPEDADHIALVRGRISFDLPVWYRPADGQPAESSAGFGAAIAIFDKKWRGPAFSYINREELLAQGEAFLVQIRREAERLLQQNQPQNIPEIIPLPETNNQVWPAEVHHLFDQVAESSSLDAHLQNKLRHHINRLKMDGLPTAAIIQTAGTLARAMGARA